MPCVICAIVLCLFFAGCGGLEKPSYSTTVNAPTFPQPQAAPAPSPAERSDGASAAAHRE